MQQDFGRRRGQVGDKCSWCSNLGLQLQSVGGNEGHVERQSHLSVFFFVLLAFYILLCNYEAQAFKEKVS